MVPDDIKYENVLDLKKTEINKSCGIDNLIPALLKNCASAFAVQLTLIFKEPLEESQLPVQLRSANLTPLHNESEKILPGNDRHISLTFIAYKIMEVIVKTEIENFLLKFNLLSKQ